MTLIVVSKFQKKIIFLSILLFGCSELQKSNFNTESISDISGLWSLKRFDSSYAEVYFSDSSFLFFHEVDVAVRRYKLRDDSIFIYLNGKNIDSFKLERVSYGQMKITDEFKQTNYFRVKDSIFNKRDWELILNLDEDMLAKYRLYFYSRKEEMENRMP